jgi:hypothetical protein
MDKTIVFDPRWDGRAIPERHWHFHRQLLARYGIVLAPGEFSVMVRDIKSGHAQLIEKRSGKRAIYSVRINPTLRKGLRIVGRQRHLHRLAAAEAPERHPPTDEQT